MASDLVQCDLAYRGIVENPLGRTVIAADLNAAFPSCGREPLLPPGDPGGRDALRRPGMTGGSVQSKMTNLLGREREIKELSLFH